MTEKSIPILVTGGAGYIGSHVCKTLAKAGYNPVTYDNLSSGNDYAVKWGPLEKGDILDQARLEEVMHAYKPAAVVHMAAFIDAGESVRDPGKYFHNNVVGGLRVIRAMKECGVRHFVFSSTATVYGFPKLLPLTERSETSPINSYGRSKLIIEEMLKDFETAGSLSYAVLRYFNAAGADPDGEIGCDHEKPNNLIPILMEVQGGRRAQLQIYGDDYDTPDGTAIRDYIHVQDLAKAHVLALQHLISGGDSLKLNLGTGKGQSVKEVVAAVERVTQRPVPATIIERRPGDAAILVADSALAKELLGWEAEFTQIDDIVATAWQWEGKRKEEAQDA